MTFNSKVYNAGLWGGGGVTTEVFSTDRLVFDGFSLSDGTIMIMTDLRYLGPSRELVGGSIPRGDGMYQTADYFRETIIEAEGIVKKSTAALLDAYLDTVRKNLRKPERSLDLIDSNSTVKRFVATLDNYDELFADRQGYHITFCPWKARFRCKTPFGKARSYTTTTVSVTSSPTNQSITNTGTTLSQPVVILIFTAATAITAASIKNTTTGEELTYTGSIAAGDLLEFDSENKTVKKNGTAVDYTGAFPSLEIDTNVLQYTVTGTSFDLLSTVKFKPTYL